MTLPAFFALPSYFLVMVIKKQMQFGCCFIHTTFIFRPYNTLIFIPYHTILSYELLLKSLYIVQLLNNTMECLPTVQLILLTPLFFYNPLISLWWATTASSTRTPRRTPTCTTLATCCYSRLTSWVCPSSTTTTATTTWSDVIS